MLLHFVHILCASVPAKMRRDIQVVAAGIAACVVGISAQPWPVTPQMQADAASIIGTALAPGADNVYQRLAFVADTFGGRLSGSQALEDALDWIAATARADGLSVTEEPVQVPTWVRGNEYAYMLTPRVKKLHMLGIGGSVGTNGTNITAPVLVVRSFDELQNRSAEAKGKIIVYNQDFVDYGTTVAYRYNGGIQAAAVGGLAALVKSIAPFGIQTPHTGIGGGGPVPSACISLEDATQLQRMQDRGQEITISVYMEAQMLPDSTSRNLIIDHVGSETPDEYVIVSGHADCWDIAEGAMDDGGGAFSSWEAVRLIHSLGIKTNRTVRAILWVNEENGEAGANGYVKDYAATLNKTSFGMESDSGTFAPYGLSFTGSNASLAQLQVLGSLLAVPPLYSGNVSAGILDPDISVLSSFGVPSAGYWDLDPRNPGNYTNNPCAGFSTTAVIPASLEVSSGYLWYHHTAGDTVDKLDPTQLQQAAASMAIWASSVANLPGMLPR